MTAVTYRNPGPPDVLEVANVPDAVAGEGELLIRVEAISIEGGDLVARRELTAGAPPRILGYAASGEIIGLGRGVEGFTPGQKVATFGFSGSHAELRSVPAATSWIIPDGLDVKVAATVPCGPGTAALALQLGELQAGENVLVTGAAGGVGFAAVQLAAKAGAHVIGTGTNRTILDGLREFGLSDAIVTRDGSPLCDQVRSVVGGEVDLLIDTVGGLALTDGLAALKEGGKAVLIGVFGGREHPIDAGRLIMRRNSFIGCLLGKVMGEPKQRALIGQLLKQAARGDLQIPIDATYRLADAAQAHQRAEQRGRVGRVIMVP